MEEKQNHKDELVGKILFLRLDGRITQKECDEFFSLLKLIPFCCHCNEIINTGVCIKCADQI